MTYEKTLTYLFSQLPMYQRIGEAAYRADLNNTYALCDLIGNPEKELKCVHVAGTNGKGSTSHMIASVLQEAGYKTGLYTSPHLKDFRERIKINGEMIPQQKVIEFVERYKVDFERIAPSFFEMTWALALDQFHEQQVDIAVIETGMGGRLDSTNVVTPEVSVITNIGFDHQRFLGVTLPAIAKEKAGIIKKGRPVVIGEAEGQVLDVFVRTANENRSELLRPSSASFKLDLHGEHQRRNGNAAVTALGVLRKVGWKITNEHVERGLANVIRNTGLQGRWQTLSEQPKVICDVAHNEDGLRVVLKMLKNEAYEKLHIVLGMVSDKQHESVLSLLPKDANYYFCKPDVPRGMSAFSLQMIAARQGLQGDAHIDARIALMLAKEASSATDLILVTGSGFVVAEVL